MKLKKRRLIAIIVAFVGVIAWVIANPASYERFFVPVENTGADDGIDYSAEAVTDPDSSAALATEVLEKLEVKGRAPKTGYTRDEFYSGWPSVEGCSLRQRIIKREFGESAVLDGCNVIAGEYDEPYTGEHMVFKCEKRYLKEYR